MAQPDSAFDHNVFINCPFDASYLPLLRALLFAVIECGFEPRIASEQTDSGAVRIDKIKELIQASRYNIHDISRMEPLRDGDLPRFNMPFELDLDLGCRDFGSGRLATKHCLILERDLYRYQRVLSDIAGNDIQAHGADPQRLVRHGRNWLYSQTDERLASGTMIWRRFNAFYGQFSLATRALGYQDEDLAEMPVVEFVAFIKTWRQDN